MGQMDDDENKADDWKWPPRIDWWLCTDKQKLQMLFSNPSS